MAIIRIFLVILLTSAQAQAGAWARGTGNTFVALSYAMAEDPELFGTEAFDPAGYLSLMIEHGVGDRLTFGLDAGRSDAGDYKAVTYLSRTFGPMDGKMRYAVQLGAGTSRHFMGDDPVAYLGTSIGRGLETPWGTGWAAMDTTSYYRTRTQEFVTKADITVGLNTGDRVKLFVQVQTGKYPTNDAYVRVVPSMAYEVRDGRYIELGVAVGLVGDSNMGVKLGTWLEF